MIETELHVLRDCPGSMVLSLNAVDHNIRDPFCNSSLAQWIELNIDKMPNSVATGIIK
jgi:hypothetical protein